MPTDSPDSSNKSLSLSPASHANRANARAGGLSAAPGRAQGLLSAVQLMLPLFGRHGVPSPRPVPAPVAPGEATVVDIGKRRQILLEQQCVDYQLVRRKRRTIGFSIDDRGLIVSAPRWVTIGEIERALHDKRSWILRKLTEWSDYAQRRETLITPWADGSEFNYLGQTVQIQLVDGGEDIVLRHDDAPLRLLVPFARARTQACLQPTIEHWLKARAQVVFDERLALYAARLGRAPRQWRLSNARTLWGSCTADQVIRLNWRLVNLPVPLIDYVVAHELAHLCQMNHSPAFWNTVAAILPDYREARATLRAMPEHLSV